MIDAEHIWTRLDSLAKPRRSLGRLEELAARLAAIQGTLQPRTRPRGLVLFAADHGIVRRGVSAWPSAVTGLMVRTILAGRAASNALAAAHDCSLRIVDVGVAAPNDSIPGEIFRSARIAPGTADLSVEPAMTAVQFHGAWRIGAEEAQRSVDMGKVVLIAGEMGIGNTTAAACLTVLLAGATAATATGRGAGADDVALTTKIGIVAAAAERAAALAAQDLRTAIASVAGFEIVSMAGFFAAGARAGVTLLVDGYVATAAALIAEALEPGVARYMIAAHRSAEPGHGLALGRLGLTPLLDWGMRLGEGTGALVALPLLDSAAALLRDVACLSELGVARED